MSAFPSIPQLRVGFPGIVAQGSQTQQNADRTSATVAAQGHGKYANLAINQQLAFASEQGTGIAPGTALGTTAFFSLYNPPASNVKIFVTKIRVGYISGTLGAGTLYHCLNNSVTVTAPSAGTLLTSSWTIIGNANTPQGVARVGSTVVLPTIYGPFCSLFAELASTANGFQQAYEDMDGEICILPGACYQLQAVAAAGSTPKMTVGAVWEEQAQTS